MSHHSHERLRSLLLLPTLALVAACHANSSDKPPVVEESTGVGHLESGTRLNSVAQADIASAVQAAGVSVAEVTPLYEVINYRLTYRTLDAKGSEIVASALVSVPSKGAGATSPVLSYQHGTTFKDDEVPSNHAVASEPAVVFASLGYIVISPDYVGYGASKGAPHPYLLSAPSASVVIDLLTAASTWRRQNGVSDNGQLFLFGYSEGGYVTVAAHRVLQEGSSSHLPNLVLAVPGAGPYHVVVTLDAFLDRVRREIPLLGALITPKLLRFLPTSVRDQLRDEMIKRLVAEDADVVFDTTIVDNYLADDDAAAERQSNVHDWAPIAPVRLFHGRDDETVTYAVATLTLQTMLGRGARDVSLTDCAAAPASHLGCVPLYIAFTVGQLVALARNL